MANCKYVKNIELLGNISDTVNLRKYVKLKNSYSPFQILKIYHIN